MDVTIIMPLYKPDKEILEKIDSSLKKQDFSGKVKVDKINEGLGLSDSLNLGIKRAKTKIVVTLHQDCIPSTKNWLSRLVEPIIQKKAIATVSKVELPKSIWNDFDIFSKILTRKEQKVITPLMDEKGCAYLKEKIVEANFFNGKEFRTAGEDFDMYIKLRNLGNIMYPDAKVIHQHKFTFKKRIKKEYQLSEGFGALVRIYFNEMPGWKIGLVKSIPLVGFPLFVYSFLDRENIFSWFLSVPLGILVNLIYSVGFWKGFLMKRQTT